MDREHTEEDGQQLTDLADLLEDLDNLILEKAGAAVQEYRRQHPFPPTDAAGDTRNNGLPISEFTSVHGQYSKTRL